MGTQGVESCLSRWNGCQKIHGPVELQHAGYNSVYLINIELVERNKDQSRLIFDPSDMKDLEQSMRSIGIIQPLLVRVMGVGGGIHAKILDGERRWRNAKTIGLKFVPCVVRHPIADERDARKESLIANNHRASLNPIEEAISFQKIMVENGCKTHLELVKHVNRNAIYIGNVFQYLKLVPELMKLLMEGKIGKGVAKFLSAFPHDKQMYLLGVVEREVKKKGRALSMNEVNLVLRREAEKKKIPRREPADERGKRGRKHESYGSLLAKRIISLNSQFVDALKEAAKLNRSDVEANGGAFLNVVDGLSELIPLAEKVRDRLDEDAG